MDAVLLLPGILLSHRSKEILFQWAMEGTADGNKFISIAKIPQLQQWPELRFCLQYLQANSLDTLVV